MGGMGPGTGFNGPHGDFYYMGNGIKGPSTAAGTYMQGFGVNDGGFGVGAKSGGGPGFATAAKFPPSESFDLDIMMPPDIASIDSDISKYRSISSFR